MDDRFTDSARDVIDSAACAARLLGHSYAGTEHLLLALIDRARGAAADLLAPFGVAPQVIREELEQLFESFGAPIEAIREPLGQLCERRPERTGGVSAIPQTPRLRCVLRCAADEASLLKHEFADVEHLLLGMLREAEGVAGYVLANHGVGLEEARRLVGQALGRRPGVAPFTEGRPPIDPVKEAPDAARNAVRRADSFARELQHEYVGCQHLMLGLLEDDRSAAAQVFANLGISLRDLRRGLLETIIPGPFRVSSQRSLHLTPGLARALKHTGEQRAKRDAGRITTAHLLLGLISSDSIAIEVLHRLGVRPETVRAEALYLLGQRSAAEPQPKACDNHETHERENGKGEH